MKVNFYKHHTRPKVLCTLFLLMCTVYHVSAQLRVGDPGVTFDAGKYDSRYPQMKEWQKAGVRGGIPFLKDVKVVKILTSGADSEAINKAIVDASKTSGLVAVLLKNGTYSIDQRVVMKSNVSLIGESRTGVKCIIKMNNGDAFSFYKVKKSGIYTLTIQGSWGKPKYDWNYSLDANDELKNNDNISVKFNKSEDCWLDKVDIINCAKDPVRVPSNHITLRDLRVDGAHKKAGGAQGYFFIQGAYNLVTGCKVTRLRHISLQGGNVEYNVVYDNDFRQEVSFHSGDKGNNLIENNRITLPYDMPNSKADTPNAAYNSNKEPNYYAIMGPWSIQHENSEKPNFIFKNKCLEENHGNKKPWSDPNLLYKGPKEVKPADPATNFPALPRSLTPSGGTLYPIVLNGNTGGGNNCDASKTVFATEDAYLQGTSRFNTTQLRVEKAKRLSYLQFTLPSDLATITEAKLSLTVSNDSGNGRIEIVKGKSNQWTEDNLSNSNRPQEGSSLGVLTGTYAKGKTYEWALSGLSAGETITLIVKQSSGNDVSFWSKEGSNAPKLTLRSDCNAATENVALSMEAVGSDPIVKVYPNPSRNFISVSHVNIGEELIVYDFLGNIVLREVAKQSEPVLDVSRLRRGNYILSVQGKNSFQFIKE
ncbi:Por secretion system C-terminal sorting domain-containing protein [Zobellia uliginosa]|uniref:Por secretion system C-terminal sorting domain-containing protein n=1 Tax=Zobellia uliginosa TaxID=143224 RepID=A0ABY1KX59_9FLAO|nr:T9SS type A sorting domain-containing protein [Zobellia uliginosa]SIS86339.1 Por secretion system C-terminal sorting domain-containing protein [Zobellia uliginosa]